MTERIEAARHYIRTNFGAIPEPEKSCIVFSGPRSGSNLLLRHLEEIGYGKPIEAFHISSSRIEREQGWHINYDDPFEYITYAVQAQTQGNICGTKLGWLQYAKYIDLAHQLFNDYPEDLTDGELIEVFFPNPIYLHLMRKNKVKQAISLSKSKQSGIWYVPADDSGEYKDYILKPVYDRRHIEFCLGEVIAYDVNFINLLNNAGIPHLTIWYEDYVSNFEEEMLRVDEYLGGKGDMQIPDLPLKKLANKTSANWYKRFLNESIWLKDKIVQQALEESDFATLLGEYSYLMASGLGNEYLNNMPNYKFRKITKTLTRIKNKLKRVFHLDQ